MHAVRFDGPRRLVIEEAGRPAVVGPGDAIVRVTTTSIGPADLERYAGPDACPGAIPGGACAGEVDATGPDVRRWRLGDAVLVPPVLSTPRSSVLPGRSLDGSHAGWIRVPAADLNLVAIADPLNLEAQAVVAADTYAVGARAARELAGTNPASVAIIGCDALCLALMTAWKLLKGDAGSLAAADSSPGRVLLARRLGARGVVIRDPAEAASVIRRTAGVERFDAAAVGTRVEGASIDLAAELAAPGAPIVLLDPPGTGWSYSASEKNYFVAGYPDAQDLAGLIRTIAAGKLDLLPLVSHTFPLAEAPVAFEWALGKQRGVLKVLLKP